MEQAYGLVAVVVPTIRPARLLSFKKAWRPIFERHGVQLVVVYDGKRPTLEINGHKASLPPVGDLVYNLNDGVRNLGFAACACPVFSQLRKVEYVLSLDDDVLPSGDTIEEHLRALNSRQPLSWLSTGSEYTRGFPYGVREEAPVMLSHGFWEGVADWDAPTQLVNGADAQIYPYVGNIPKGVLFPLCAMNFAFRRAALPYVYQAPMGPAVGLNRFADIWGGIELKKDFDRLGWAVVTGYASVKHERASNVFQNLEKEARGLSLNEEYGKDAYFRLFFAKRARWQKLIKDWLRQ